MGVMVKLKYTYKQDGKFLIGRLDEYPEYPTQAFDIQELEANLLDIYEMIRQGELEAGTQHGVLEVAI
jgi:hypothetical protein